MPKPAIIIAQVPGSGTPPGALAPLADRNTPESEVYDTPATLPMPIRPVCE